MDDGGYFPEDDLHKDAAWFMMQTMKLLGYDAVGVGERDLRWGVSYLRENVKANKLPVVCANLVDNSDQKLIFPASIIVDKGGIKVGIFGLITDKGELGPSRDSLAATEPTAAAKRAIEDLHRRGAAVIVCLSDLGKVESEDLATAVDGIDVLITGRNVPLIQKGRLIKNTMTIYGGEQGQNVGRTVVTMAAGKRKIESMDADVYVLGAEIPDKPEILQVVKAFEDNLNEKMRKAEKEEAAQHALANAESSPDHYVGEAVCERCHKSEADQWRTTAHSRAWKTLVDNKKDADPECETCHVVGFQKPGGFQTAQLSPAMSNVQCENCHGMGTQHEAFAKNPPRITEATCRQCHNETTSPDFSFSVFEPHILHKVPAVLPPLPHNPGMQKVLDAEKAAQAKKK